jgi:metal-responsive CopG/Arc/MetJ family transcriptional regulator
MAVDKEKHTQILVTFPNELVELIEEHFHKKKLKNRSEAIRDLVVKGLKVEEQKG